MRLGSNFTSCPPAQPRHEDVKSKVQAPKAVVLITTGYQWWTSPGRTCACDLVLQVLRPQW